MRELWSYDKKRRVDKAGRRWHFVTHHVFDESVPYSELPHELFFRDDERKRFGLVRFERRKDNPYRDYDALVSKVMNDSTFRKAHEDPGSRRIWRRGWK